MVPVSSFVPVATVRPGVLPRPMPFSTRWTWRGSGVLRVSPAGGRAAGAVLALGTLSVSPTAGWNAGALVVTAGVAGATSGCAPAAAASAQVTAQDASAAVIRRERRVRSYMGPPGDLLAPALDGNRWDRPR